MREKILPIIASNLSLDEKASFPEDSTVSAAILVILIHCYEITSTSANGYRLEHHQTITG